jgi:hypothetical protein
MKRSLPRLFAALCAAQVLAAPAAAASWPDLGAQVVPTDEGRNDAAVIIAVEDYIKVDDVAGARANADAWMRWFMAGRGVPAARIFKAYDGDATDIQIRELAKRAAASVQPGGTLWFVYIGHGAPSVDGTDGLLVGVDADRSAQGIYQRSVPRSELLALLDAGKQAQTVALLDACFSGQSAAGASLVPGLQPLVPTALVAQASARTRVLSAAGSGEFSGPLPGGDRPAFSYLTLGALMGWADVDGTGNRDGKVSAVEVRDYVQGVLNVAVQGRTQTPSLLGTDAVLGKAAVRKAPVLADLVAPTSAPVAVPAAVAGPVAPTASASTPVASSLPTVASTAVVAPPRAPSPWARRAPLLAGAVTSFAGAGVLYALAAQGKADFDGQPVLDATADDPTRTAYRSELEAMQASTNGLTYGAFGAAGLGVVLGAVTVVAW